MCLDLSWVIEVENNIYIYIYTHIYTPITKVNPKNIILNVFLFLLE